MRIILTSIAFLFFGSYIGANEISDSLKQQIIHAPKDSVPALYLKIAQQYARNDFDSAIHYCNQAISEAIKKQNSDIEADAYKTLGMVLYFTGDFNGAIEQYNFALKAYKKNNNQINTAKIYNNLGLLYLNSGETQKGINNLEKAIGIYKQNNAHNLEVGPLINLGLTYYKLGNYSKAISKINEAKLIAEENNNQEQIANATANLATIFKEQGMYIKAINNYNIALDIYIRTENHHTEAKIYHNLGVVYEELGQYNKAIEYVSQGLLLKRKLGAKNTLVNSLNKLGDIYCQWSKYDLALDNYHEAITIEDQHKDQINLATSLSGIAGVYADIDLYNKALDNLFEALKIFEKAGYKKDIAQVHNSIGEIYAIKLNNNEKAKLHFNTAEMIFTEINYESGLAALYYNKGSFELKLANYQKAIVFLNKSIGYSQENKALLLASYSSLAKAYKQNKDFQLSAGAYDLALMYKDSALIDQTNRQNLKYELLQISDKKSIELEKLRRQAAVHDMKENKNKIIQSLFIGLFIILLFTTALILYLYLKFRKSNKKLHKQQVDNEFQREQLKEANTKLTESKNHAEKISGYKSEFLANISHEIRTPLNAITGYINLLQKQIDPENKNNYINNALIASENLSIIINDLLDISKIEAGKMVIEKTNFNPIIIVTQAISTLKLKAEEKNIAIELHFDPLMPDSLLGDPYRLNQILTNLINNAIKFSDSGQDVSITATHHTVGNQCELHFSIIDQGVGIASEELHNIFESFTQISSNTARNKCGTGLGLAIVKRLIELQNGKIEVSSKVNEGSKFSFHIKYQISDKKAIKKQTSTPIYEDSVIEYNLLLVEDNEINQELAKDTINSWKLNLKIDVAENGKVAIDLMSKKNYDVILMDIQMPEMNGHETTLYIRNSMEAPHSKIPIIGMTAHALPHEKELALRNGMNEYIIKPFNPDELKQKISYFVFNHKI